MARPPRLFENQDSLKLLDAIRKCSQFMCQFDGEAYRTTSVLWATQHDFISGAGSLEYGGRWNPPGLFKAGYLSRTPETALVEALATNRRNGLPDSESLPVVTASVRVKLERILDVSLPAIEKAIGVTGIELTIEPYDRSPIESRSQAIGRLAWSEGYEGLIVPSAARPGFLNLVVLGKTAIDRIQLLAPTSFPKRKRYSTRKTSTKRS